jgi:hypothetical protein
MESFIKTSVENVPEKQTVLEKT